MANQNNNGTPHHPKKIKEKLKQKSGWDWDAKIEQIAVELPDYEQLQNQYPFFYSPLPGTVPNPLPSPSPFPQIPWGAPIPVMP